LSAKKSFLIPIFCLTAALFSLAAPGLAEETGRLSELRHDLAVRRLTALQPVLTSYLQELDDLGNRLLQSGNIAGAQATQQEKRSVEEELNRLAQAVETARLAATPAMRTAAPTVTVANRQPVTQVSSIQGLAGAASFSENNIYKFTLPEVGPTGSLTYYATGRRSTDTVGVVWLITPEGTRVKIAKWKGSNFKKPAIEVESYQELKAVTEDISGYLKGPGTYQVEFEWTDGIDPLVIYRVEITS
jgi:hypothetical protein